MAEKKRRGRPSLTPLDLSLKLNEHQRYWLDYLVSQGFRGNAVEEVALRLLDDRFRELYDAKVLPDPFLEPIRNSPLSDQPGSIKDTKYSA